MTVSPTTAVQMALSTMTTHGVSQLPVVLDGECVGSVREAELMAAVLEDPGLLDRSVEGAMDTPFPVVDALTDAEEVSRLLRQNPAVLVRRDGSLDDIVTRYDVVRDLTQSRV
jgi:cystathionine beta-synthase